MPTAQLLFRCRSLYEVLDLYLDQEMGLWSRSLIKMHLLMCKACRSYLRQYQMVRELVESSPSEQLPEDFEQVMTKVLRHWKQQGPASS